MIVKSFNRYQPVETIDNCKLIVIMADNHKPLAIFGEDQKTKVVWSLKAGDAGFDQYIKDNKLASDDFSSGKLIMDA